MRKIRDIAADICETIFDKMCDFAAEHPNLPLGISIFALISVFVAPVVKPIIKAWLQ